MAGEFDEIRGRLELIAEEVLLEPGQCVHRVLRLGPDRGAMERCVLRPVGRSGAGTPWALDEEERAWLRGWAGLREHIINNNGYIHVGAQPTELHQDPLRETASIPTQHEFK